MGEQGNPLIGFGQRDHKRGLVRATATLAAAARTAKIAIVHLYQPGKDIIGISLPHSGTDSVQKIPCDFIADIQEPAQLRSRDPPLIYRTQLHCPKPCRQGQMCAAHDRSGRYGGLAAAVPALTGIAGASGVI